MLLKVSLFSLQFWVFYVLFITGEEPEDSDFDLPKVYEPMESFESLKDRLNTFLSHYNESIRGAGMDMVFFRDAMIHLIKVLKNKLRDWVLSQRWFKPFYICIFFLLISIFYVYPGFVFTRCRGLSVLLEATPCWWALGAQASRA